MPSLIIVNGAPGVGKTTLAANLSKQLGISMLSKDQIKEFLFDTVAVGDREWSKLVGRASIEMLYSFTEEMLKSDQSLIIENAFWKEFAAPKLKSLIDKYHPNFVEVYCHLDEPLRVARFNNRQAGDQRHPGHVHDPNEKGDPDAYQELEIGRAIRVDMTSFKSEEYLSVVSKIRTLLEDVDNGTD